MYQSSSAAEGEVGLCSYNFTSGFKGLNVVAMVEL